MDKTKKAATKTKRARTGTKTTAERTAGKTAKATEVATLPRSDKQIAEALWARMQKTPDLWERINVRISHLRERARPRVAPVDSRKATH